MLRRAFGALAIIVAVVSVPVTAWMLFHALLSPDLMFKAAAGLGEPYTATDVWLAWGLLLAALFILFALLVQMGWWGVKQFLASARAVVSAKAN